MTQIQLCMQPLEFPKMDNRGHPWTTVGPFLPKLGKKGQIQVVATKAIPFTAEWKATASQLLSPLDVSLLLLWRKSGREPGQVTQPFCPLLLQAKNHRKQLFSTASHWLCPLGGSYLCLWKFLWDSVHSLRVEKGILFFLHPFFYFEEEKKKAGEEKKKLHQDLSSFQFMFFSLNFGFRGHNKTF